ncbi:OmpH family outer membrane protein [Xanthomarina sp. F1114]|uniref:OmpH family outer membrane protein n=1 Tax=Xanthomarina sp. F1114 TaxID=2996019 RepID=UPI00225E6A57|nr:OmpH family outer membrane protein [Xanthomarina sp. F1114]MCX7546584.1 OmpH family outer membrane protein [Xanthomarina sp. F1114]
MKNIILIAVAIVTLVSCDSSLKTGFVDNGELVNKYQEKIDIEAKFKTKVEAFQKRTDSTGRAFQVEAQAFQEKAKKMTDAQAQQEYQVLGQKQQMLQQRIQAEEQQIQEQSQAEIDSLLTKVKKFVKEYGEKNGYTYIFGSNDAGSVMYGKESNDLTKTILDALNADYKK